MINIKQVKEKYLDYGEITVPCGKCLSCLQNKRADWTFRIKEELKHSSSAHFVTLTYDDDNIPWSDHGNTLDKTDLQKWLKRLRINQHRREPDSDKIRYYAVGEYGEKKDRPHYHVILFNSPNSTIEKDVIKSWTHGSSQIGTVTPASIHYVTGYIINRFDDAFKKRQTPFALMSRKPPLGYQYLERNKEWHKKNQYFHVVSEGNKQNLPRFYRDRIFNDEEKLANQLRLGTVIETAHQKEYKRVTDLGNEYYQYKENQQEQIDSRFAKTHKKTKSI